VRFSGPPPAPTPFARARPTPLQDEEVGQNVDHIDRLERPIPETPGLSRQRDGRIVESRIALPVAGDDAPAPQSAIVGRLGRVRHD